MNPKPTILIVDDDADFVEALAFFLQNNGFAVVKARDGTEGLKLARMRRPDLIIMDIVMNERTEGFFTVQEMRRVATLKNVPIFVLSSLYATHPDFQISPEEGWLAHDEFFSKPANMTELLQKIRQRLPDRAAAI